MATPSAVLNIVVVANTGQATGALAKTQAQLTSLGKTADASTARVAASTKAAGARLAAFGKAGALGVAAVGVASTKLAVDFERGMRNVNSIAQLPEKNLKRLSNQVLDLAGKTAQAPQTLAEGLYDLVSSGFDSAESMQILGKSAKAATAGLTDTKTSTKAVAAVLNAYRLDAEDAGKVSDILFRTVDRGVISFEELASNIGYVLPAASALGVDLAQVGASIATLTKEGQSGASAVVNLNQAMTALFKPSEAMQEALKAVGAESAESFVQAKGFQGALEELIGTTDGSTKAIGELFGNVRAQRAVFGLIGKNAGNAARDIEMLQDSSGATARALEQQSKSLAFQWQKFTADLQASAIKIGNKIIPALRDLLEIVSDPKLSLAEKVTALGDKLADVIADWAPKVGAAAVGVGAAILKGIVDGFLSASLIGKIGIAALLVRVVGGRGALLAAGRTIATTLIGGIGSLLGSAAAIGSYGKIATALGAGLARAASLKIPIAFAAFGIGSAVADAIGGDMREAGFKAGGALAGGLVGSLFGPGGALVGAGIGSMVGDLMADVFKPDRKMQERIAEASQQAAKSYRHQAQAMEVLQESSKEVRKAHDAERKASSRVAEAQRAQTQAVRKYGRDSEQAVDAEKDLARARNQLRRATNRAERAERQHGIEKKATKDIVREAIGDRKDEIYLLEREVKQRKRALRAAVESNQGAEREGQLMGRLRDAKNRLSDAQTGLNKTIREAAQTVGPHFAKSLRDIDSELKQANQRMARAKKETAEFRRESQDAGGMASRFANRTQTLGERMKGLPAPTGKATTAVRNLGGAFTSSAQAGYDGMANIGRNVNRMGSALTDQEAIQFGLTRPKGGKGGGGSTPSRNNPTGAQRGAIVPGAGSGDKVPLHLDGRLAAMVEPGELVSVANKKATAALMKVNDEIPRFAGGGIVALGKQLQKEGYEVGENPAFGGVTPGVHDPGGYHPTGQALDVNDDSAPFAYPGGETASLTRLYNRLKGMAGVVELLWQVPDHYDHLHVAMAEGADATLAGVGGRVSQVARQIVTGPDGAIKDFTQGALDKVRSAANKYLSQFGGSSGGVGNFSGKLGAATVRGRATWFTGGTMASGLNTDTDPGIALNPNAGGPDPSSWNNPTTQAWLQARQPFLVKVGGKEAVLPVLDMGPAGWTGNAIDVNLAGVNRMGFSPSTFPSGTVGTATLVKRMLGGLVPKLGGGGNVIPQGPPGSPIPGAHYVPDIPTPNIDLPSQYATGMVGGGGGGGGEDSGEPTLPKIPALLRDLFGSKNGEQRRKMVGRFLSQLKAFGLAGGKADELDFWLGEVAKFGEFADRASGLEPGEKIQGKTELEWLQSQLEALRVLRNHLLDAQALVGRYRDQMQKLLDRARRHLENVRKKLDADKEKAAAISDRIEAEQDKRADLKKALEKEMKVGKGKRDKDKIESLRQQIEDSTKREDELKRKGEQVAERTRKHGFQQAALRERLIPGISDRLAFLKTDGNWSLDRIAEELETVHGLGSPSDQYERGQLPALGELGGQIFETQMRIRDLLAEAQGGRDPMTIAELQEFANAVSLGAFRNAPFGARLGGLVKIPAYAAGGVHGGGLALVGERGPEVAALPSGTRIHSNQDSQAMLSPTIYADIYIGGERIAEKVEMQIRKNDSATLGAWRAGAVRR